MNNYLVYVKFTNGIVLANGEIEQDERILNFKADTAQGAYEKLQQWASDDEESQTEITHYFVQMVK
jgi:hypothetical protein